MIARAMSSLLLLFLLARSTSSIPAPLFEPLRILIIRPDDGAFLPAKLERAFHEGVARIEEAIAAVPLHEHTLKAADLLKCIQLDPSRPHSGTARMISPGTMTEPSRVNLGEDIAINRANFAVVLEINKERCEADTELMASANPCYAHAGHRPPIARVRVCPQLGRWTDFLAAGTASDVFRHELLHALGWGTVVAPATLNASLSDVSLNWNVGGGAQPIVRKFLDFGKSATEFARRYFNCPQLEGIETEREDKMHLSEYIFGNELMTPVISTTVNYFTEISARILEETHLGAEPWYSVNRTVIAKESAAFSYGRGWGCEFVAASCHDYINLRLRQRRSTFPFCSGKNFAAVDKSLHICTRGGQQALRCDEMPLELQERSANGITPSSIALMFPGVPARFASLMASGAETRFCPFIQAISMDTLFFSPPIDEIREC